MEEAAGKVADDLRKGLVTPEAVTPGYFENRLYTAPFPPVSLLIRTSGERRLSNFLLWQSTGAYLYFTRTLWPDFNRALFYRAVKDYQTAVSQRAAVNGEGTGR